MQSACAVLYCHLWPVWLYHIFPHYLINGTIFGKKLLNIKCVFWFSLQLLSETFLILKIIQEDIINVHRASRKVPVILVRFWSWIFSTDFEKYANIKVRENSSIGCRVVLCGRTDGQTDGHNEANSRFSQFCERAWNLNEIKHLRDVRERKIILKLMKDFQRCE